jgi:hypothetical protein
MEYVFKCICLLIIPFFTLSSCGVFTHKKQTYTVDSMVIANNLSSFQAYFNKAVIEVRKAQEKNPPIFTDVEWETITNFIGAVNFIIAQEHTITQLQLTQINDDSLKGIVELAQKGYIDCYNIVFKHWDSFSPETQFELKSLNDTARNLNNSIVNLYSKVNSSSINTSELLTIIMGVLTVSIKILAVVAA